MKSRREALQERLREGLERLDERIVKLWLDEVPDADGENAALAEDERWDLFVMLLESRVELLRTCRDAGLRLSAEQCLPSWLEQLCGDRREIRVRELRMWMSEGQRRQLRRYREMSKAARAAEEITP